MNLQVLYRKLPPFLLVVHLLAGLVFCLYVACLTDTLGGDTLEHIHSSWLVYANFVPYKDFFQHHNPLLWYIFSPFVGLHAKGLDDNIITAVVISAAVIISFINYLYLYLITTRFLSSKFAGIIAAAIAFTPYIVLSIIHFRPDNFMMTAFFAGLYYYFCHIKEQKLWQLVLAFVLFWCSFMFLQKIVFTLLLIGIITFYLLCIHKLRWENVLYAITLPLVLSLGFAAYLYQKDILTIWYHSNFTFNLYIPKLFDERRIGYVWPELKLLLIGSACALLFCLKKANIYFKIITLIFIAELCQRLLYFSAFAYYYYLLVYTASILTAVFLAEKVFSRWYIWAYVLVAALGWCMYKPAIYNGNIGNPKGRFYEPLNKKIVRLTNPCDYILNGDGTIYNLYNRDPHYYWNLLGQTDVIGAQVGIRPLMNINEVIEKYKPKIISGTPYYDKYASERGLSIVIHRPDTDLINKYYKPMGNDLYILKPEYSPAKCEFNYKKRYYRPYD